jgi:hypothetical protein
MKLLHQIKRRLWFDQPFRDALTAYEQVFREILTEMHSADVPPKSRLGIDFYWHSDTRYFDAFAYRRLWWRSAGLRIACWHDVQGMANILFRSSDMFAAVGDPSVERRTFVEWLNPGIEEDDNDAPTCPIRREAANLTVEFALALIILHEIAHHALGHLDTNWSLFGFQSSSESLRRWNAEAPQNAPRMHANEVEADRFAFSYLSMLLTHDELPFSSQLIEHPVLRHVLFELAVLAYALNMFFLGGFGRALSDYDTKEHPHPIVRFIQGLMSLRNSIQAVSDDRSNRALTESIYFLSFSPDADNLFAMFQAERDGIKARCAALDDALRTPSQNPRYSFRDGVWK